MSANVETMFYVREKPWHGLGTMVQEAPTSADALRLAGLDWTVEARDMWLNGGYEPIPGYKANVRSSDNKVLGVVSDKYRIVQNADAGRRKPKYTITVEDFGELLPDPKLSAEREYQLLQIPLEDGRFELVSTSLVEIEYY